MYYSLIVTSRGISSAGRAVALQAIGQRFDPVILHQTFKEYEMKKIVLLLVALLMTTSTFAQHAHHSRYAGGHNYPLASDWVVPLIIGGAVVYAETRNNPAPVMVYDNPNPPVYVQRTPQPVYAERTLYDYQCQCWIKVLQQTGWQ